MAIITTGSNTTGTRGLIAVDKVANKLRFYDPHSLQEVSAIDGPEPCVHELAIEPGHAWAAVPLYGDGIYGSNRNPNNKILIVDLEARRIAKTIALGDNLAPHGMVALTAHDLWVVCDVSRKLVHVDVDAGQVTAAFECPALGPHILVSNTDGSRLYVSAKEGDIAIFDLAQRAFVGTVPMCSPGVERGNGSGAEGITPMPGDRHLIAIDNDLGDLHVIDATSLTMTARHGMVQQALTNVKRSRLGKLMFSPGGDFLVVTAYATGNCWIVDGHDLARQRLVPVAKGPMGMAFGPDGETVIVASDDSGVLTRIHLRDARPVAVHDGGAGIEVLSFY